MVYHQIFNHLQVRPLRMTKTKPKNGQNRHVGFTLFLVSKQVHDESKAIFFKEAMFDLRQHTAILTPSFEPFYSVRNLIESKPSNLLRMEEVIVSDPWTAMHFGKVRKEMSVDEKAGPVSPLRYMTIDYQWKLESAWLIFEDEKPAHSPSAWQKMLLREVLTTVVANSGHTQVQYTLQDFPFEFDLVS